MDDESFRMKDITVIEEQDERTRVPHDYVEREPSIMGHVYDQWVASGIDRVCLYNKYAIGLILSRH